jgi:putative sugar O-methyltransferase
MNEFREMKHLSKHWLRSFLKRFGYVVVRADDWRYANSDTRDRWLDRYTRIIQHPPVYGQPHISLSRTKSQPGARHLEVADRLIHAFIAASRDEADRRITGSGDDVWTEIQRGELAHFWGVIERRDPRALSEYLLRFGEDGMRFGGLTFFQDGYNQINDEALIALSYFDKAVCLAEAMGCIRHENPEQGEWGENLYRNVDEIFDAIEEEFGAPITPPQHTTGVFGIRTSRGVFHYRHMNALYAAWRIRGMLSCQADAVCEFGGGLGAIPYFLRGLGVRDYTIYDLPIANVFAGHFLMNSLSPEHVVLYGEKDCADAIKVLPYWQHLDAPDKQFELTINQDSFPEIDAATVRSYISNIQKTTRKYFISINHEAESPVPNSNKRHLNVSRLMGLFPSFRRIQRSRYWIREGYVEEVYAIDSVA